MGSRKYLATHEPWVSKITDFWIILLKILKALNLNSKDLKRVYFIQNLPKELIYNEPSMFILKKWNFPNEIDF